MTNDMAGVSALLKSLELPINKIWSPIVGGVNESDLTYAGRVHHQPLFLIARSSSDKKVFGSVGSAQKKSGNGLRP